MRPKEKKIQNWREGGMAEIHLSMGKVHDFHSLSAITFFVVN
jgi:hypothetical protein